MTHAHGLDSPHNLKRLPGHWILARMGKRVLRPGGRQLTRQLLEALAIGTQDDVVEFALGLGATARLTLLREPKSYTAIERDLQAAATVQKQLAAPAQRCLIGSAENTGLPDAAASVVYGEAMLTMQSAAQKTAIAKEAFRVLRSGGRYGIHEIALVPDDLAPETRREILKSLSYSIHVGVRPQTIHEWQQMLEGVGFRVKTYQLVPMHLLEPRRIIQDEGLWRTLCFAFNVLRTPQARKQITKMRSVFRRYEKHMNAILLVAEKP